MLEKLCDFAFQLGWRAALALRSTLHGILERLAELEDRVTASTLFEMMLDLRCVCGVELVVEVFIDPLERFTATISAHTAGRAIG
ncbi:MAG TPA: hypothetical protein VM100_11840 [Longimicrobiales bacterium]|nr:hypothetical protein [Longimicrobiales bacterium]